ncbi:hypothetical protein PSCLAVI8L_150096 [Pseudoclavibacter sp. 8L]|nr:hypothetical protein PSCLAVI8L_150096 [Pseudoclavibacter sp. 8L]
MQRSGFDSDFGRIVTQRYGYARAITSFVVFAFCGPTDIQLRRIESGYLFEAAFRCTWHGGRCSPRARRLCPRARSRRWGR